MTNPASMRRQYQRGELDDRTLDGGWLELFGAWFDAAAGELSVVEANAMQVATVSASGEPSVRTVLLKEFDADGLVFFTNYDSAKGRDLAATGRAAAVLAWLAMERQIRVDGAVTKVSRAETEEYFATRPRESQLGAWASPQSQPVRSRAELDALVTAAQQRFAGQDVPAPPHWGGYRIGVDRIEFWQGRAGRMHDRLRWARDATQSDGWLRERLAP